MVVDVVAFDVVGVILNYSGVKLTGNVDADAAEAFSRMVLMLIKIRSPPQVTKI